MPKALDVYCGAGGASAGLVLAGFDVVGVDNKRQRRYPYEFLLDDALRVLADLEFLSQFDLLWASPPCQRYSKMASLPTMWHDQHPMHIEKVRALLQKSGRPYVIENVETAPLLHPVMLCGAMFGLRTYRHRLFECSHDIRRPVHPRHMVTSQLCSFSGHDPNKFVSVYGKVGNANLAREVLEVPWMSGNEASQCVPPKYSLYVGKEMIRSARIT